MHKLQTIGTIDNLQKVNYSVIKRIDREVCERSDKINMVKSKKLIGIAAPATMYEEENPRKDVYNFGNNYGKRIYDCGGIPLGILPSDGWVEDTVLDQFDGFLICGGHKFWPYHLQIVDYAVRTGKPLLGICLGMQSIYWYFRVKDYIEETEFKGSLWEAFQSLRAKVGKMDSVEGHQMEHIRGLEEDTKHEVELVPGSLIQRLVGTDTLRAGSFHRFKIGEPSSKNAVTGKAPDGTIEVIEYGEQILGVQFHPEIDQTLLSIFSILFQ